MTSSKFFAMAEFSDANQSCKYFDEVKDAGIQRYTNTCERIQYLIKLLEGNYKTCNGLVHGCLFKNFAQICNFLNLQKF